MKWKLGLHGGMDKKVEPTLVFRFEGYPQSNSTIYVCNIRGECTSFVEYLLDGRSGFLEFKIPLIPILQVRVPIILMCKQ